MLNGGYISLKVHGQDGLGKVFFRMKRGTMLKKLIKAYCARQSVDYDSTVFMFNGQRLQGDQTPGELEMEENDEINAILPTMEAGIITLKVIKGLGGIDVFFRMKKSTRLMKLMDHYCKLHSVDYDSFVFIFHGRRLRAEQTPGELVLKESHIHALMINKGC